MAATPDDDRPPWEALPTDALRHCLSFLPDPTSRAAARATCARWRATADDSVEVWGSVAARRPPAAAAPAAAARGSMPPAPQQLAAVLGRQRQHLRRAQLELGCVADAEQARAPPGALPEPPQLEAEAQGLALVLAAACQEGSGLTDLVLAVPASLPDCVMEALPGAAAQLTALTLSPLLRSGALLRWAQLGESLRGLHSLSLTCDFGAGGPPASLAALTALTHLKLHAVPAQRGVARAQEVGPALAAAAPGLLHLKLENVSVTSHEPPDEEQPPLILDPSDSDDDEQPGLAADALAGGGVPPLLGEGSGSDDDLWPPALAAGPGDGGLPALAVDLPALVAASGSDSGSDDGGPPGLYYSDEDLLPDLHDSSDDDDGPPGLLGPPSDEDEDEWPPQRPLALLLWDRWQRLEALRLSNCNFRELAVLPRLPCLTSLHLTTERSSWRAVESVVLRCSHLQELVLGRYSDHWLPELPGGALQQLTRLRISSSRWLRELHPSWCALPALLSFEVESCDKLRRLPGELTALTGLQRIRFGHQHMEQLPTQITGLSQLTRLAVTSCSLRELPDGPYLSSLQELNLFANQLDRVPPALAGVSGLRLLDLSSNYSLQLSGADVATLAQLPALALLDLSTQYGGGGEGGAHPADALAELRSALPRCEVRA